MPTFDPWVAVRFMAHYPFCRWIDMRRMRAAWTAENDNGIEWRATKVDEP